MTEQNKHPDLTEHLRQFQHNDGSGLVFGYDKEGIDKMFASLNKQPQVEAGEGAVYQRRRVKELLTPGTWEEVLPITYEQNYEGYEHRILYTSQSTATQAAVAAAYMRAAEVCDSERVEASDSDEDQAYNRALDHAKRGILALIHADDMQALRELLIEAMEVARLRCYQKDGNFSMTEIVSETDRILAETGANP
jgi:hypothetical protein